MEEPRLGKVVRALRGFQQGCSEPAEPPLLSPEPFLIPVPAPATRTRGHVSHNLYFQLFPPRGSSSFLWLQLFTECWDCALVAGPGWATGPGAEQGTWR